MILDEIYREIIIYRGKRRTDRCAFHLHCEWCEYLFPEILVDSAKVEGYIQCPCFVLGYDFVRAEMQRLFP